MAQAMLENYAKKYIQTGSPKPLLHFMTTVGVGCYIGECVHHARSEAAAKRALKTRYEEAVEGYEDAKRSKVSYQGEVERMRLEIQQTYQKIEQLKQDIVKQKEEVESSTKEMPKYDDAILNAKKHMEAAKKKWEEEGKH
mmetsp:Transcript_97/g.765  ORF Transcript_97/g.765 Transcript_97/m.765 type:complete len:140 (+) Transcript_97:307-726(+)